MLFEEHMRYAQFRGVMFIYTMHVHVCIQSWKLMCMMCIYSCSYSKTVLLPALSHLAHSYLHLHHTYSALSNHRHNTGFAAAAKLHSYCDGLSLFRYSHGMPVVVDIEEVKSRHYRGYGRKAETQYFGHIMRTFITRSHWIYHSVSRGWSHGLTTYIEF